MGQGFIIQWDRDSSQWIKTCDRQPLRQRDLCTARMGFSQNLGCEKGIGPLKGVVLEYWVVFFQLLGRILNKTCYIFLRKTVWC